MERNVKAITVYAASSHEIDGIYVEAASDLGRLLAKHGITCIYGGGSNGLMGAVADAVLEARGKVWGIIPQFMVEKGWLNDRLTEVTVTKNIHERKQMMAGEGDACIALPGGVGTMEELLEVITWRQLGLYNKPVVILNTNNFYADLLSMLLKIKEENFMPHDIDPLWRVAQTPEEALHSIFYR
ncbi:MAG: TIGR00730 family Rossman fold protein [Dysgonamonadaceae bacterium]|jgi:uncharacterized protein (TIGR00730 family)|nr:TIGR00730 family Rossman fold protein [Dysgonamonadaceae bacterium]